MILYGSVLMMSLLMIGMIDLSVYLCDRDKDKEFGLLFLFCEFLVLNAIGAV